MVLLRDSLPALIVLRPLELTSMPRGEVLRKCFFLKKFEDPEDLSSSNFQFFFDQAPCGSRYMSRQGPDTSLGGR